MLEVEEGLVWLHEKKVPIRLLSLWNWGPYFFFKPVIAIETHFLFLSLKRDGGVIFNKKVWLAENYIRGKNMLYKASQALRGKMV